MIERHQYYCMNCNEWILEDDMVTWNGRTKRGFCRDCASRLSSAEMMEIEEVGFYQGEQLSIAL